MFANQPQEDEAGRHFVKVDFNINDVRLLANAVNFYLERRIEFFDEEKKELPEPTEHVIAMKRLLTAMILENTYHSE